MRSPTILNAVLLSSATSVIASPALLQEHHMQARQQDLPIIKLPYATYQATKYDRAADVYIFRNIRFAAPPIANLRFAKPAPPEKIDGIQNGSKGGSCPSALPSKMINSLVGNSGAGSLLSGLAKGADMGRLMGGGASSEDCLFLDVYVPAQALKSGSKLPVLNFFYGGAYILGNKEGLSDGTPLVQAANNSLIYVAGNYRLSALGFMGGTTVEKDKTAIANAGFWDQRAILEWIQKYITLFGGNPADVTSMGSSAGAGSIMHHLTGAGGKQDPLFKKAILESAAYAPSAWDRKGNNEKVFKQFEKAAGCEGKGISCLRGKDVSVIAAAQLKVVEETPGGAFGFGPMVDGGFVRQMPQLELLTGNFAPQIESLIVSHVTDEANMFVSRDPNMSDQSLLDLANSEYANNSAVTKAVWDRMPLSKYSSQRDRIVKYVQFSTFTCYTRYVSQAYKGKTYNVIYSGSHGSDMAATFFKGGSPLAQVAGPSASTRTMANYQKYLVSFVLSGSPNKFKDPAAPEWPKAELGPEISNVLKVDGGSLGLVKDPFNTAEECDFWANVYSAATNTAGLAPPGGAFKSYLAPNVSDASANWAS